MRTIDIFDTTLRDGEQSAGVNLHSNEKLEIAYQLERYGVNVIEAGFPVSSASDFESCRQIAKQIKNCSITGLARSRTSDIDAAWEALKDGVDPRLHLFIATSPIHMQHKLKMAPQEVIDCAVQSVRYARSLFPKVQWSAEDATRSDWAFLAQIIEKVIAAGASVINLPDTVGYIHPEEYANMFRYIQKNVPNIDRVKLSAHCHDDLGVAVANTLAAIDAGVEQIEGTINGIGERAGNAALEEVSVALAIRQDVYGVSTSIDLSQTVRTSKLVSQLTGMVVPQNKAVVGDNAFAHESGIHQDGVLKHKLTYEIIEPEMVGLSSNKMILGKHSGRHAFKEKCLQLGLRLEDVESKQLFSAFKKLTDKKKEVTDEDILALYVEASMNQTRHKYTIEFIQVAYGSNVVPTTTVGIRTPQGAFKQESATGKGSVESLYNAIERLLGENIFLKDYRIQSTTSGRDSLAEVYVNIQYHDQLSRGRGLDTDVLEASAKAYMDAINRVLLKETAGLVEGVNVQ